MISENESGSFGEDNEVNFVHIAFEKPMRYSVGTVQ